MTAIAWILLGVAVAFGVAGFFEAAAFVAIASLAVAIAGPDDERADARRRNPVRRARPVR